MDASAPHGKSGAADSGSLSEDALVEFTSGEVIAGQFEVVRLLGRGGMGVVYEVADRVTKQHLALKVLLPSVLHGPETGQRFVQEVNVGRRLRHPGIAAIYDVRREGPLLFCTMEFVEGGTLRAILDEQGVLPLKTAAGIIQQMCDALAYAHEFAVHRDLCPNNVMIRPDRGVSILDFGICRFLDGQEKSSSDSPIGKKHYIAPEQMDNPDAVDARTDVFALGVMFHEMLTGETPSPYRRISALRPDLPPSCERVITQAVAPLGERYKDIREFWNAISACLRDAEAAVESFANTAVEIVPGKGVESPPLAEEDGHAFMDADDLWMIHRQTLPGRDRAFWIRLGIIAGLGVLLALLCALMM